GAFPRERREQSDDVRLQAEARPGHGRQRAAPDAHGRARGTARVTRHARALGIAALIAMFAACGSPPAPAPLPESQPWCVALDRYLQTHAGKQSDLVYAGNEPRARALSDCQPIAIERRSLPWGRVDEGGPALEPAPGSWLAGAVVQGGPGLQRVTIDLEGAELERVASTAETLSAAAQKGQCGELRRALCLAEPDVLEA